MSEFSEGTRAQAGTAADRAPLKAIGATAVGSGAVGILVATADWANTMVQQGHYVVPDNALMVMWATALAPLAELIYRIVFTRIQKAAEE